MNRRRLRLSILLVLVAAIAGGIWYASRSKPVKVVVQTAALGTVERRDVTIGALDNRGLEITSAGSLREAAQKIVEMTK